MGLYDDFMNSVTVEFGEPDPNGPKLIHIDEHRCYFENRPNVIFNTSLTNPSREHAEKCIKNAAYNLYIGLLKKECRERGIDENLIYY